MVAKIKASGDGGWSGVWTMYVLTDGVRGGEAVKGGTWRDRGTAAATVRCFGCRSTGQRQWNSFNVAAAGRVLSSVSQGDGGRAFVSRLGPRLTDASAYRPLSALWEQEWVSSFLTARQHTVGYSVSCSRQKIITTLPIRCCGNTRVIKFWYGH